MLTESLRPPSRRQAEALDWGGEDDGTPTSPRGGNAAEDAILSLMRGGRPVTLSSVMVALPQYDEAILHAALWLLHVRGRVTLHLTEVSRCAIQ